MSINNNINLLLDLLNQLEETELPNNDKYEFTYKSFSLGSDNWKITNEISNLCDSMFANKVIDNIFQRILEKKGFHLTSNCLYTKKGYFVF